MQILVTSFLLACVATTLHAENLTTAIGKTDLGVKACAEKAGQAFSVQGASVTFSENISDWTEQKSGSLSAQGVLGSEVASIVCRPFESDMVVFVSYSGADSDLNIRKVWDEFYK